MARDIDAIVASVDELARSRPDRLVSLTLALPSEGFAVAFLAALRARLSVTPHADLRVGYEVRPGSPRLLRAEFAHT
jgi:hypothetical protein